MDSTRYAQILAQVEKFDTKIGDLPSTGAASLIQDRLRHFTDAHGQLKDLSSEVAKALNEIKKTLSAVRSTRKVLFKDFYSQAEQDMPNRSQSDRRERAEEQCAAQDTQITQLEESYGDLETLRIVVENKLDAVKVSTSNLRKEWETMVSQQHTDEAAEKVRRTRESVEQAQAECVLHIEGSKDAGSESGNQTSASKLEGQEVSVDDLLEEFGKKP